MARIAIFQPILSLDLDTGSMTINFGGSLIEVQGDDSSYTREKEAGEMLDNIIGLDNFGVITPLKQATALRNLARHIDAYVIQEQEEL